MLGKDDVDQPFTQKPADKEEMVQPGRFVQDI